LGRSTTSSVSPLSEVAYLLTFATADLNFHTLILLWLSSALSAVRGACFNYFAAGDGGGSRYVHLPSPDILTMFLHNAQEVFAAIAARAARRLPVESDRGPGWLLWGWFPPASSFGMSFLKVAHDIVQDLFRFS